MQLRPLNYIDFYKPGHYSQYPKNTTLVVSNLTPRASRSTDITHVVFTGLQYLVKEYLIRQWDEGFFRKPKAEVLAAYKRRTDESLGEGSVSLLLERISELHDLGYLPIEIVALKEGSIVPIKVAPLLIWATNPRFFWLSTYLEDLISFTIWQPSTSATIAYEFWKEFMESAKTSGSDQSFVQFQGHDFSLRGMSSLESAKTSGFGHLLSFRGSDNVPAIDFSEEYYGETGDTEFIAGSIPATEHSVMCMGGDESEFDTYERILDIYPSGPVSIVSDTWDYWNVLTDTLPKLKDRIMARDGKVVIRPDSGDPVRIICGWNYEEIESKEDFKGEAGDIVKFKGEFYQALEDKQDEYGFFFELLENQPSEEEVKGSIEILWEIFGGKVNEKGFKELDSHIGLIYGDSITLSRAKRINEMLILKGFASTNWVAGVGSYTYQYNTRDTLGWAMKATYAEFNEDGKIVGKELFKDPKTDSGIKRSARGLIAVYWDPEINDWVQQDRCTWEQVFNCEYEPVFENGKILREQSLGEIRKYLIEQHAYRTRRSHSTS